MTLTFSYIIDFDDATNLFLRQVYSLVDACLIWTDLIILISWPVRWDKLYQSTHFKGKLHKLPIKGSIIPRYMIFTEDEAEVNIIYLGTIDPYNNRNESQ